MHSTTVGNSNTEECKVIFDPARPYTSIKGLLGVGQAVLVFYRNAGLKRGKDEVSGFKCVVDVDNKGKPKLNPEGKVWNGN